MASIVEKIKKIPDLSRSKGCSFKQIKEAQEQLDMVFPAEFVDYVKEFGCIDFGATEWTGLNIKGYLNTVTATQQEKSVNSSFPQKHFVLEDLNIDAKKVIVDEEGKVYMLQYEKKTLLCNAISEYLDMCIEKNS
jgi:hypothetical protein